MGQDDCPLEKPGWGPSPPPPPLGFASGGLGEVAMFSIGGQMRLTGAFLNGFWKVVFFKR